MNAFEYISELKQNIESKKNSINGTDITNQSISMEKHLEEMLNLLNVIETELEMAEYNYEVESVDQSIETFEDYTLIKAQLSNDVLIFQPLPLDDERLSAIDLDSIANILQKLRDANIIKEDMILLPPDIKVFRAKLKKM